MLFVVMHVMCLEACVQHDCNTHCECVCVCVCVYLLSSIHCFERFHSRHSLYVMVCVRRAVVFICVLVLALHVLLVIDVFDA
jgi:hypothetical protein